MHGIIFGMKAVLCEMHWARDNELEHPRHRLQSFYSIEAFLSQTANYRFNYYN